MLGWLILKLIFEPFAKNKGLYYIKGHRIYISDNWPAWGQGLYAGKFGSFAKRVYYSSGIEYHMANDKEYQKGFRGTVDVCYHETGHNLVRLQLGFFRFWGWFARDYFSLWVKHDSKPFEIEANKQALALRKELHPEGVE